jgi:hypothetical protein
MTFDEIRAKWDEAGFTDDEGRLGKPVPTGDLLVPNTLSLDATKESLVWRKTQPEDRSLRFPPDTKKLFNGFVGLWNKSPAVILGFAKQWGPLYLDPWGTPCVRAHIVVPGMADTQTRSEPLEVWRYWSRRAQAVINIAASLKEGPGKPAKKASPDDWKLFDGLEVYEEVREGDVLKGYKVVQSRVSDETLSDLGRRRGEVGLYAQWGCPYSADWGIDKERRWLRREIQLWLALARPGFGINANSWRLEVDYNGCVFAAIALQLALTVTGSKDLFTCSACGSPYVREMKAPKVGDANYCPNCKKPLREANRRVQKKKIEARKLHVEGFSDREIAKKLNVRTSKRSTALQTVRRWIKEK